MTLSSIVINTIGTVLLTSFVVTILNQSVVINTITTTNQPSLLPTYQPTLQNTSYPSLILTDDPSLIPTMLPSSSPTNDPSVDPTSYPTQHPSSTITVDPTNYPTIIPSSNPSINPTVTPSIIPTVTPSINPTVTPSINPTVTPSIIPTTTPSIIPTTTPSIIPTTTPSIIPTTTPSIIPTTTPSIIPTITPSINPTHKPSSNPSLNPTIKPSITPTYHPSVLPTRIPTSLLPSIPAESFSSRPTVIVATTSPINSNHPASPPIALNPILNLISNSSHPICESTYGNKPIISKLNTCTAYNIVKTAFNNLLPVSTDILARGKLFGKVIRLAYHDAVEFDIRTSDLLGPDGCLSEKPDNAGLLESESLVLTVLEPIWQQVCGYISRADYWIMFAILVLGEATTNKISINYQYGRKDNLECGTNGNRLPGGQSGMIDINKIFTEQMGLTISDAVVLLGGHSLGYTNTKVSGYGFTDLINADPAILNAWDNTPHILDNEYFFQLTQKGWKNLLSIPGHSQWGHFTGAFQDPLIMLNPDMAIAYTILPNNSVPIVGPRQVCGPKTINRINIPGEKLPGGYGCRDPSNLIPPNTWDQCVQYTADNTLFLFDFAKSFTKMSTVGYGIQVQNDDGSYTTIKDEGKLGMLTSLDLNSCSL